MHGSTRNSTGSKFYTALRCAVYMSVEDERLGRPSLLVTSGSRRLEFGPVSSWCLQIDGLEGLRSNGAVRTVSI